MNEDRIRKALNYAVQYGGIDGDHHKAWVIDQMVRALTGCPILEGTGIDVNGHSYMYIYQGESEEYKTLVDDACGPINENGEREYDWDVGIPP